MSKCVRCGAKAKTFGCNRCTSKLRKLLADLPEWLTELEATAAGTAKLGGPVRRSPRYRRPLDGDAHPLAVFPDEREEDLTQARHDREEAVLRDALARGRVNARASDLAGKAHAILTCWVQDLCKHLGQAFPTFQPPNSRDLAGRSLEQLGTRTSHAADLADWLHAHTTTIAASEDFDLIFTEIAELTRDIQHAVDKPTPPHKFGPCPEMISEGHNDDCRLPHPHMCDTELRGHRRATEVKCDSCGTVHQTDGLFERQAKFAGGNSYTLTELSGTILPALGEYVPHHTMQHWATTGKLNPTGYTAATAVEDAQPRYQLDDIRALWEQAMSADAGARRSPKHRTKTHNSN